MVTGIGLIPERRSVHAMLLMGFMMEVYNPSIVAACRGSITLNVSRREMPYLRSHLAHSGSVLCRDSPSTLPMVSEAVNQLIEDIRTEGKRDD